MNVERINNMDPADLSILLHARSEVRQAVVKHNLLLAQLKNKYSTDAIENALKSVGEKV